LDFNRLKQSMRTPILFDLRNIYPGANPEIRAATHRYRNGGFGDGPADGADDKGDAGRHHLNRRAWGRPKTTARFCAT
ncbi:hypothetical protein ACC685_39310, partial [Rhizobium ruizarguesonis]